MLCVRLNFEPIVLLATADTCEDASDIQVSVLDDARLSIYEGDLVITYVDVDASIVLFSSALRTQPVRVVLQRTGHRERLSGTLRRTTGGGVRCELANSHGQRLALTAAGLRASDWRESTAA